MLDVSDLRAKGQSWREISRELGVGVATARAALLRRSENLPAPAVRSAEIWRDAGLSEAFKKLVITTRVGLLAH
jgi:hypothetical protein